MQWSEVEITTNGNKILRGGAARSFVEKNCPAALIETILKNSIRVQISPQSKTSTDPKDVRFVLFASLRGKAKSLRIMAGEHTEKVDLPAARVAPNVHNVNPALLQMYLDVNRDGAIDAAPANHADWTWGAPGHGAVIVVKTKIYTPNATVGERLPVEFRWQPGMRIQNWQATLNADYPARLRVFRQQTEGAAAVPLPCNFNTLGAEDAPGIYRLWIEAADFPETTVEAEWLVKLDFKFEFNGAEKNRQTAVLRTAPWIMASDLDPTHRVFLRTTEGIDNPLPDAIDVWVGGGNCERFMVEADKPKKGFARDVMKSGYTAAPHFSGTVIQERLDVLYEKGVDKSPLKKLAATAATNINGGRIIKGTSNLTPYDDTNPLPDNLVFSGQDNGGNLLVSPPSPEYPWGRILFGGNDTNFQCHSEHFYRAQKVQNPIRLNSTWLRVGHVDEMLSFVRGADGTYRALLLSLRLAYIMTRGVACRVDANAADLIIWATGINNQCIAEGVNTQGGLLPKLANLPPNVPKPNPFIRFAGVPTFEGNPAVPVDSNRFVIVRLDSQLFPVFIRNNAPLVGMALTAFNNAFPIGVGRDSYEYQVHSSEFIAKANNLLLNYLDEVQPVLDDTRRMLRDDLGFTNDRIIDVPVILNVETGKYIALTGDSVNLLQIAGNPASRCLVPKPFGPIFAGEYVYERYLADRFAAIGVPAQFLADDKFHLMEGEIHCGTNQTHPPLDGAHKLWWNMPF